MDKDKSKAARYRVEAQKALKLAEQTDRPEACQQL
jgi:hypothetical protein